MAKAYSEYTLTDLISNPLFLIKPDKTLTEELQEEDKNEQLATLKYITNVAKVYGITTDIPALATFGDTERKNVHRLTTDTSRIDSYFSAEADKKIVERKKSFLKFALDNKENLASTGTESFDAVIQSMNYEFSKIKENTTEIESLVNKVTDKRMHIAIRKKNVQEQYDKFVQQASTPKPDTPVAYSMINKVLDTLPVNTTFTQFKDRELKVLFAIDHDIVLGEHNEYAGVDYSVNLGKFGIAITYKDCRITTLRAFPIGNNLKVNRYPHPHIATSFGLCFGDIDKAATTACIAGDIFEAVRLTYSLLNSYSPTNPYETLPAFYSRTRSKKFERCNNGALVDWLRNNPSACDFFGSSESVIGKVLSGEYSSKVDDVDSAGTEIEEFFKSTSKEVLLPNIDGVEIGDLIVSVGETTPMVVTAVSKTVPLDLPNGTCIIVDSVECVRLPVIEGDNERELKSIETDVYKGDNFISSTSINVNDVTINIGDYIRRVLVTDSLTASPDMKVLALFPKYMRSTGEMAESIAVVYYNGNIKCVELNETEYKTVIAD